MDAAVVLDCEFLTAPGAPSRFWCGPHDPDPVVAQLGAVRIGLVDDFPLLDRLRTVVVPRGRDRSRLPLDPLFTRLTGIGEDDVTAHGIELPEALRRLDAFSDGARLWSWGKDEFNLVAISCYVAGVAPPIPVGRFSNACDLLLKAGMPLDEVHEARSNTLADRLGIDHPPLRGHDALDDALSVAHALRDLPRRRKLVAADLA